MPSKDERNRATYSSHLVRVRRDSLLAVRIAEYVSDGQSFNHLVNCLLADYFNVPLPYRQYLHREVLYTFVPDGRGNLHTIIPNGKGATYGNYAANLL